MSEFTDRARAEAERRWHGANQPPFGPDDYIDTGLADGFVLGAQWAAEQEPTEEEVEAAARAMSRHWRDMHTNEWHGYQKMLARAALLASRDVRRSS